MKNNIKNNLSSFFSYLKKNWIIISILILASLLRLIHLTQNYAIWWDSSIYLGVAKYIYSAGNSGLWEPYRPLIHPLILGFFWKIGTNLIWISKALDLIFSLTTILLSYLIAKKAYSKIAGNYAALILAIEPLFIMYTGLFLTEPISLTLGLLAVYLFINRKKVFPKLNIHYKYFLIGALFAISALSKFPLGIIFPAALIARQLTIKFQHKSSGIDAKFKLKKRMEELKESFFYCLGFIFPFIPYLSLNYILYKDPLFPFTSGTWIIGTFLWQYDTSFWFYFTDFFNVHKLFLLLAISMIIFIIHKDYKNESRSTIFLSALLLFLYFWLQVPRKEVRYLVLIFPFFTILIAQTIVLFQNLFNKIVNTIINRIIKKSSKNGTLKRISSFAITIIIFVVIFTAQSAPQTAVELTYSEYQEPLDELGNYINKNNFEGMILVSSPFIAEHVDNLLFPTAGIDLAEAVYEHEYGKFNYLFIRDCDYVCQEGDFACEESKTSFLQRIDEKQILLYFDEYDNKGQICNLYFYMVEDTTINN